MLAVESDAREGLLLPYQAAFLEDPGPVRVCLKSRRAGMTTACGFGAVLDASKPAPDGSSTFYLGTNETQARTFMRDAVWKPARAMHALVPVLDDDASEHMYRASFRTGHEVIATTSSAANLRGKKGHVIVDEAAYHDQLEEVIAAALPLTMEGGIVSILSSPRSTDDHFWRLVEQIRSGELPWSLHEVDFDAALAAGYFRRIICPMRGLAWSPEAEARYREETYRQLGDAADTELRCKPRGSGGRYFERDLVRSCCSGGKVARLTWASHFGEGYLEAWAREHVDPLLDRLDRQRDHTIGYDFAMVCDLSVLAVVEIVGNDRRVPWIVEMAGTPYAMQKRLVLRILERVPKLVRGLVDATGVGAPIAQEVRDRFGQVVAGRFAAGAARPRDEQTLEVLRWAELLPPFKRALQDGTITLPDDEDLVADFDAFTLARGLPAISQARTRGRGGSKRHGDAATAVCLALAASVRLSRVCYIGTGGNGYFAGL